MVTGQVNRVDRVEAEGKSDYLRAVIKMNDMIRYLSPGGLSNLKAIFIRRRFALADAKFHAAIPIA